jgi:hypothetical protein
MSLASVAVGTAVLRKSTVWARRAMGLGVGKRMKKVWGELVGYRPSNEGVLLRPSFKCNDWARSCENSCVKNSCVKK